MRQPGDSELGQRVPPSRPVDRQHRDGRTGATSRTVLGQPSPPRAPQSRWQARCTKERRAAIIIGGCCAQPTSPLSLPVAVAGTSDSYSADREFSACHRRLTLLLIYAPMRPLARIRLRSRLGMSAPGLTSRRWPPFPARDRRSLRARATCGPSRRSGAAPAARLRSAASATTGRVASVAGCVLHPREASSAALSTRGAGTRSLRAVEFGWLGAAGGTGGPVVCRSVSAHPFPPSLPPAQG